MRVWARWRGLVRVGARETWESTTKGETQCQNGVNDKMINGVMGLRIKLLMMGLIVGFFVGIG